MDLRRIHLKKTLEQLTNKQLWRVWNAADTLVLDTYNYDPETDRY